MVLSDKETRVLGAIRRAAREGKVCPTNSELAQVLRVRSISGPAAVLQKLELRGIVTVQRWATARQVTIVATGETTAMPENAGELGGSCFGKPRPPARNGSADQEAAERGGRLSPQELLERREAAERARAERETYWLQVEAEKYQLPRAGRPISGMPA